MGINRIWVPVSVLKYWRLLACSCRLSSSVINSPVKKSAHVGSLAYVLNFIDSECHLTLGVKRVTDGGILKDQSM